MQRNLVLQSIMDLSARAGKKTQAVVTALLTLALAIACATTKETGRAAIIRSMTETQIIVSGKEFKPSIITIPAGTTVTWINHGGEAHSVTSSTGIFNGELGPVNGSFNYTFNQSGSYEYHCDIFDYHVMTGRVVVQ